MKTRVAALLVLTLFLTACAARQPAGHHPPARTPAGKTPQTSSPYQRVPQNSPRQIIVQTVMDNTGVPYRWGGKSPSQGFDCSGLVWFAHQEAGIPVPRTAKDQWKHGKKIKKSRLTPGDLVFFTIPKKRTAVHVGVFIGNNTFVHAPGKGRRVTRARLDTPYFKAQFKGAANYF